MGVQEVMEVKVMGQEEEEGGGGTCPRWGAAAAVANPQIAAIDAAFNAAVGGANLTKVGVKEALHVYKVSAPALSELAKKHMLVLMNSLDQYSAATVITPALLAASSARQKAAKDSAVEADVASRSGPQQRLLDDRLHHSGNPKVNPASPKRPSSP